MRFRWLKQLTSIVCAMFAAVCLLSSTQAAPPAAGSQINNQAFGNYINGGGGTEQMQSGVVTVLVQSPPSLSVTKASSTASAARNESVIFTINGNNAGTTTAVGIPIVVDGNAENRVVVRDTIPPNTTFEGIVNAGSSRALYHEFGNQQHEYRTTPPANLADVDAVAFDYTDLQGNQTVAVSFSITINTNASGSITNIGEIHYSDGIQKSADSNPVKVSLPASKPTINYYTTTAYKTIAAASRIGTPLFVQTSATFNNRDPQAAETCSITLVSAKTRDQETFIATETSRNSGVFQILPSVPTERITEQQSSTKAATSGDGIIQTVPDDVVTATVKGEDGQNAVATILIDPFGVVFNSADNQPIAGAVVTLIDVLGFGNGGKPNEPAKVFGFDGITEFPHTITTTASGQYQFPLVVPSTYRLLIQPPGTFTYPSTVPSASLPGGRVIDASGSYGGTFVVSVGTVNIDVPMDPIPLAGAILIEKTPSRTVVELGDSVSYSIQIKNTTAFTFKGLKISDDLPAGFSYQKGTARLDKNILPDPVGGAGPHLEFEVGTLEPSKTVTLTYRTRVGPTAAQGNGINRAQATTASPRTFSNVALAQVKVEKGVFTEKGIVFGKIFVDTNLNGIQDDGEPGVPGVRFYMENGNFVISDSEGKFSIYGLSPRTHVLKADNTTLPRGAELLPFSTRHAGDGGSRFVDLKNGEFHKANFAIAPSEEVIRNVMERRKKDEVEVAEIEKNLKERLPADNERVRNPDFRTMPATGILGESTSRNRDFPTTVVTNSAPRKPTLLATNTPSSFNSLLPSNTLNSANSNLPRSPSGVTPYVNLEMLVTNLSNNTLGFIDLKDNDTLPTAHADVRVKGTLSSVFILKLNGEEVSSKRIGKKAVFPQGQIEAWEFIGITFKPGENTLELIQKDPFGNDRGREVIKVRAPDKLGRIKITLPKAELEADGVTPAKVIVELTDAQGVPVTTRTPLVLESTEGRWDVTDLDKAEPGVQVFIEGGRAEYTLLPPQEPVDAIIRVSSGVLKEEARMVFLPDLRPMIAAGIIEGAINMRNIGRSSIIPARSRDGFEEELRSFSVSGNDEKNRAAGRVAFFLKGKIKGDYLLTAGYDSDKDTQERLFRDIEPDQFYPVYGDSSIKGYDAQSTGRLYVRVDKKKSYLLYGDFTTQSGSEVRSLGNYNRSLTGIREHYEKNRISANVWASEDSTRQVVEEIRANGTSGPYAFSTRNGIVNSEKVEIITRDRNQPSIVLDVVPMQRFTDYEFEPFTGQILFKAPVPSLDENLNPIFIRVTYETETNGDRFWVYGGDVQVKVTDRIEVGGSAVRDENPQDNYQLLSANSTLKLGNQTYLIGEVAQSDSDLQGTGNAGRVELRHKTTNTEARIYYGRTEESFTNNSSLLLSGRVESGLKLTQRLTDTTRLLLEGIYTEDSIMDGHREGARIGVEKAFEGNYRIELGARYSTETSTAASTNMIGATPNEVRSVRLRVTAPVPMVERASVYGEYENDVIETDNRMVAVGGDYQLKNKGRLYARHEFINALGGPFELNNFQQQHATVVGVDTEYMKDGKYFSEYRARDSFAGRQAEAAIGLRNGWTLAEGIRANTTFERVSAITGGAENESTAVTGGIEYTRNPDWKGTARLELRQSDSTDSLLNSLGYARKVSKDWTFLTRTLLYMTDNKSGSPDRIQGRFQSGMAYRQTDTDRWSGLGKYEYRYEEGTGLAASSLFERREVHILSLDVNYQPAEDWIFSGHYAGKLAVEDQPFPDIYHAHLISGRAIYEITKRWDVGLNVSTLFSGRGESLQFGVGPEIGFTIKQNLRVGVGYNIFGFRDRDLANQDYTEQGVYVHLRLKFDEGAFGLLRGKGKEKE